MKKSSLFLVSAAAMLFLAACGPKPTPGGESSEPAATSQAHKHTYGEWKETKAPTCTEKGSKERTCTECGEKQTQSVSAKGHTYVEDTAKSKAATCTEGGTKVSKCSVCGDEKTEEVDALGHDNVKAENQTGAVAPTCEEAGTQIEECSRCHEKVTTEVPATGHTWGEDTWTKAATCTEPGEGTKTCETCNKVEAITEDALGHDIQLIGDDTEPEAGKAKVRLYSCAHEGCDQTYFGFKASEPSEASKEHLVINEDGGTKFWGQPIGNSMVLNENGDASGADDEKIFDETQTGDFFEYVFDLTAEQVATMGEQQHLYCNAKAANYLSGKDFWAADPTGQEWTPGYYIEGEKKGEAIADYRYILYVDDAPQEFDPTMTAPVTGSQTNQPQKEYVMPYTFKLHAGTNKIRLVMAGGYKSTFYNFTFRPAEKPADPVDPEVPHEHAYTAGTKTGAMQAVSCSCGKTGVEMVAADLTEGQKAPVASDKNTRLGKNIFDDKWDITGIAAGTYELYINAQASSGNANNGYWNSATAVAKGDTEGNNGGSELCKLYKYTVAVDDAAAINMGNDEDNYAATGLSDKAANWTTKSLATVTIAAGAKTLTIHNNNNGYSIWVFAARLVKVA